MIFVSFHSRLYPAARPVTDDERMLCVLPNLPLETGVVKLGTERSTALAELTSYILHPTPYHPTSYILHPTCYSPTSYTLHNRYIIVTGSLPSRRSSSLAASSPHCARLVIRRDSNTGPLPGGALPHTWLTTPRISHGTRSEFDS